MPLDSSMSDVLWVLQSNLCGELAPFSYKTVKCQKKTDETALLFDALTLPPKDDIWEIKRLG